MLIGLVLLVLAVAAGLVSLWFQKMSLRYSSDERFSREANIGAFLYMMLAILLFCGSIVAVILPPQAFLSHGKALLLKERP